MRLGTQVRAYMSSWYRPPQEGRLWNPWSRHTSALRHPRSRCNGEKRNDSREKRRERTSYNARSTGATVYHGTPSAYRRLPSPTMRDASPYHRSSRAAPAVVNRQSAARKHPFVRQRALVHLPHEKATNRAHAPHACVARTTGACSVRGISDVDRGHHDVRPPALLELPTPRAARKLRWL